MTAPCATFWRDRKQGFGTRSDPAGALREIILQRVKQERRRPAFEAPDSA
jgi:hypothetical protein